MAQENTEGALSTAQTGTADRSVAELLTMIDADQIMLPEIQREFVWTKTSIKLLVDSMFKGLPIGSMLVWKPPTAPIPTGVFDGKKGSVGGANLYGYLLDGQQRLTALMLLRDRDPRYPLMYWAWPERDDPQYTFYWRATRTSGIPASGSSRESHRLGTLAHRRPNPLVQRTDPARRDLGQRAGMDCVGKASCSALAAPCGRARDIQRCRTDGIGPGVEKARSGTFGRRSLECDKVRAFAAALQRFRDRTAQRASNVALPFDASRQGREGLGEA